MNALQITVLCDNRLEPPLISGHGLATWIDTGTHRVLFDTGPDTTVVLNAAILGIDLSSADAVVLSHGHYDHTGGLPSVLPIAQRAQLFLHGEATVPRYSRHEGVPVKSIGMPPESRQAISAMPSSRLHYIQQACEIVPGLFCTGTIPRTSLFENTGGPFFLDEAGTRPDLIIDDIALWHRGTDGITVITGCCHAGIVNTLEAVIDASNNDHIAALIGGLHLLNAETARKQATRAYLDAADVETIIPLHCSGDDTIQEYTTHARSGTKFRELF